MDRTDTQQLSAGKEGKGALSDPFDIVGGLASAQSPVNVRPLRPQAMRSRSTTWSALPFLGSGTGTEAPPACRHFRERPAAMATLADFFGV